LPVSFLSSKPFSTTCQDGRRPTAEPRTLLKVRSNSDSRCRNFGSMLVLNGFRTLRAGAPPGPRLQG
jgi:hypothetical protein